MTRPGSNAEVVSRTMRLLALLLTPVACGGREERVELASRCSAIVGGYPDARYDSVAALRDATGRTYCTATLIGASGDDSLLLSAAHCLDAPVTHAAFGAEPTASSQHEIVATIEHPEFDRRTGDLDFALLLASGWPRGVDPLPIVTLEEDALVRGARVEFVGYGETEGDTEDDSVDGVERRAVEGIIDTLTSTTFGYLQSSGGPCAGDSGGPAIAQIEGQPRIVGVTSFGDGNGCWSKGVSGRVSAASSFVRDYLGDGGSCAPR